MVRNSKISVCLASYNGEKYIKEQLKSILSQLNPEDEVVVSDDNSKDNTVNIINSMNDRRVKLMLNSRGKGVIKNFENAIINSSGDYIFLADQDDIWRHDKVETILNYFKVNEGVTCIFSNALIVDKNGLSTGKLFFPFKPKISLSQVLIKNRFLGCTMAFCSNDRLSILPFSSKMPMHDWFIGLRHILKGKVAFIDDPLIYYRRHGQNVTTGKSAGLFTILKWRLAIIQILLKF